MKLNQLRRLARCVPAVSGLLALLLATGTAIAETQLSFYLGKATHQESDLDFDPGGGGGGGGVTFDDVSWDDESFRSPLYYGARVTHFFAQRPSFGLALDFVHAKMYPEMDDAGGDPLSATFDSLNFSHGLNLLTLNALYRWNAEASADDAFLRRLQPYVGLGAGVAIPHVEVQLRGAAGGTRTFEYQFAGPAYQLMVGVNVPLAEHWAVFTEYRLSYADLEADLDGGGTLETDAVTHHFVVGVSLRF